MTHLLDENHWINENHIQRVRIKDAQKILIEHPTISFHGRVRFIKSKHIGAGVYEISKQEKKEV